MWHGYCDLKTVPTSRSDERSICLLQVACEFLQFPICVPGGNYSLNLMLILERFWIIQIWVKGTM